MNVLLALHDPEHVHFGAAHRWFTAEGRESWATCPIVQNGFVRILGSPRYPNGPGDAASALAMLRRACATAGHEFWADDISLSDGVDAGTVFSHGQVTDVYLLALAAHHGGRLATFDSRIPVSVVKGGHDALVVIPPP